MGRYLTYTIDKAKKLEEWTLELAQETNRNLDGSELYDVSLCLREPFQVGGKKYNSGFVGMRIRFTPKEPDFLTEDDRKSWYSSMREIAKKRFKIDAKIGGLEYASISFEEPTEEELYAITPNKVSTIRAGFDRVRRFVEWYCSAVKDYERVTQAHDERMEQCLVDLETLAECNER